jgi:hypothetical protein
MPSRLRIVLKTISQEISTEDAIERLGVSETRFHQIREKALKSALEAMEPGRRGRPGKDVVVEQSELDEMKRRVQNLERDLSMERARNALEISGILDDEPKKKRPKGFRRGHDRGR